MRQWSMREIELLRRYAHMGAPAVSLAIRTSLHIRRSPAAVQRQASRMGISMAKRYVCDECGFTSERKGDFINATVCRSCAAKARAAKNRAEVELLRSCAEGTRRGEFERSLEMYENACDAYRQQKHRLREEVGEEAFKKFEKVSAEMSNRRSEAEKSSGQQTLF